MARRTFSAHSSSLFVAMSLAAACGDDGAAGAVSGTAGHTATTSTGASTSSTTTERGSESTSSGDADTSTTTAPDLPRHPTACDAPEALIDVTVATTPEGPITVDEAWVWYDYCDAGPFVVLVQRPTVDGTPSIEVEIELQALGAETPLLGSYPAMVRWARDANGTMELLEPFTNPHEPGTPHPDLHLHAQIEIHSGGYDISVEVDLIDCGVSDCSCPCR
jgi:hypothetical protein